MAAQELECEQTGRWAEVKRAMFFYKWHMVSTAMSWLLLDIDFYAMASSITT